MKVPQAEVLAQTYADLMTDRLATKDDIALLQKNIAASEDRLIARIEASEGRLIARIKASEDRLNVRIERMVMRTALMVVGLLGSLIVLMRFLPAS